MPDDRTATQALLPRVLFFPASLRRDSHQARLVAYLAGLAQGRCTVDILQPAQVDLPLFNQDLEHAEPLQGQMRALHQRFLAADGLVVATPEYNGHAPPYLKNTLDWISRLPRVDARYAGQSPFRGKPLLLASASTGWTGGILGLQDARSIFGYLGCLVVGDQVCVSHAEHWVADGSYRFEPAFGEHIACVLQSFLALAGSALAAAPAAGRGRVHA